MNENCLPNWKCANRSEYNIANSGTQAVLHEFNKAFFTSFPTTIFMKLASGQQTCADIFCRISSKCVKENGNYIYKLFYAGK